MKLFIKGVQPSDFARELELREFKEFKKLKNHFARTYFENYQSFIRLKASGLFFNEDGSNKKGAGAAVAATGANKSSAPAAAAAATTRKFTQVPTGSLKASPAKDSKGPGTPLDEITCWTCGEKGHRASACPKKAAAPTSPQAAGTSPTKTGKSVSFATPPSKRNGSILRRDSEVKRCEACCFIGACGDPAPTLAIQAKLDSYSDCNLIPEQWLVALRGEGVEAKELDVPMLLSWDVGEASVRATHTVDLAVRVVGWTKQDAPLVMTFYVLAGDRDALTIGFTTMFECDLFADMRAIVAAQRALGLTQVTPSPQGDPVVRDMDGRTASLADRDEDQSERERLAEEARSLTEPLDPDFVDPNEVGPDELFIGRRSLAWLLPELLESGVFQTTLERGGEAVVPPMEITLKEGFTVPYVKGFRRYSPRMQEALDLEVARQLSMGVIEPCEEAAVQEVVMVRKDDAPNGFRMTLDARAVNAGMVVEPCNPPPVKDMLHALEAKSYYARLDLLSAY